MDVVIHFSQESPETSPPETEYSPRKPKPGDVKPNMSSTKEARLREKRRIVKPAMETSPAETKSSLLRKLRRAETNTTTSSAKEGRQREKKVLKPASRSFTTPKASERNIYNVLDERADGFKFDTSFEERKLKRGELPPIKPLPPLRGGKKPAVYNKMSKTPRSTASTKTKRDIFNVLDERAENSVFDTSIQEPKLKKGELPPIKPLPPLRFANNGRPPPAVRRGVGPYSSAYRF